jgi:hypothetical protein
MPNGDSLNDTPLTDTAYEKALAVLRKCAEPTGIKAAAEYYPDVWTRDSMIAALGALLAGEEAFDTAVRNGLVRMAETMTETGHVHNYIPHRGVSTGTLNNAIDANLWFLIGHWYYWRQRGDTDFVVEHLDAMERALFWLRCQDSNEDGLLESQEGADWADLFPNRNTVLLPNVLYHRALAGLAEMQEAAGRDGSRCRSLAREVREGLRLLFWLEGSDEHLERTLAAMARRGEWKYIYKQMHGLYWSRDYFFAYMPFREVPRDRFDTLGNLAAILFGVADAEQTARILDYIRTRGIDRPHPCKACYPPIYPGDRDWRDYMLNREYCKPHSAHNGGIWPFIGGFYVAALAHAGRQEEAGRQLLRLAEANRRGLRKEWEFNELLHGESGEPFGAADQAWSAGMYLFAHYAVRGTATSLVPGTSEPVS